MPLEELEVVRNLSTQTKKQSIQTDYEYRRSLRREFETTVKQLFKDHEGLGSFSWTQATDPDQDFEFFVNRWALLVNGITYQQIKNDKLLIYPAYKDVAEFIDAFDDDELKLLFGDHARVTVVHSIVNVYFWDIEQLGKIS